MKACLHLSGDKYVEIEELEKILKSTHHGSKEIVSDEIKSSLFNSGT